MVWQKCLHWSNYFGFSPVIKGYRSKKTGLTFVFPLVVKVSCLLMVVFVIFSGAEKENTHGFGCQILNIVKFHHFVLPRADSASGNCALLVVVSRNSPIEVMNLLV